MFIRLLSPTFWLSTIHELKSIAMVSPSSSHRDFFSQEGLKIFHKSFTPIIDYSWQTRRTLWKSMKIFRKFQNWLYFDCYILYPSYQLDNDQIKWTVLKFCNNAARAQLQEKSSINTSINCIALMLGFWFGINYINKVTVNINKQTKREITSQSRGFKFLKINQPILFLHRTLPAVPEVCLITDWKRLLTLLFVDTMILN